MQRYFIDTIDLSNKTASIEGNDFHHLKNVMRHRVNDKIIICNLEGLCYYSEITEFTSNSALCHLSELVHSTEMVVKEYLEMDDDTWAKHVEKRIAEKQAKKLLADDEEGDSGDSGGGGDAGADSVL